jgi:hypothetical protein
MSQDWSAFLERLCLSTAPVVSEVDIRGKTEYLRFGKHNGQSLKWLYHITPGMT